jgi:hypothetical protein
MIKMTISSVGPRPMKASGREGREAIGSKGRLDWGVGL